MGCWKRVKTNNGHTRHRRTRMGRKDSKSDARHLRRVEDRKAVKKEEE